MKILFCLILGIAIGSGSTFVLMSESSNTPNTFDFSSVCPIKNPQNENLLKHLQQENSALLTALKDAKAAPDNAVDSSIVSGPSDNTKPDCVADVNKAFSAFSETDKIVSDLNNAKSPQDYDANLYNNFLSEEPNEAWTKDIENKFYAALSSDPDRQAIVISSLECRAKTCKVKIPVADQSAKNSVTQVMSDPSFSKALGFKNFTTRAAIEITGGEMTFYISDNR